MQSETRKGRPVILKNHHEMFRVKSLIRMLNDCSGFAANSESSQTQIIQTIQMDSKSLYTQLFEPKFVQSTQYFYE